MMIHEYQAKALLKEYGVPSADGPAVQTPAEAYRAAEAAGAGPFLVKAQIHAGGRGRAGGILPAANAAEAEAQAARLLGRKLVTAQTGPEGRTVSRVMVCPVTRIKKEYYLSFLCDTQTACYTMIVSAQGGMGVEEASQTAPGTVCRVDIPPLSGFRDFHAWDAAKRIGLGTEEAKQFAAICRGLYRLLTEKDCSLIEINPLALTEEGRLIALDAKAVLDDSALFRHPELAALRDPGQMDEGEARAASVGISYVYLGGNIGCVVNGAGLAMATMDMIRACGGSPANFLDVGGSATEQKIADALEILLDMPELAGIFVNIFGGIMGCDTISRGIVRAAEHTALRVPLVVRLAGANAEAAKEILTGSGIRLKWADDLLSGAQTVCAMAAAEKEGGR